MNRADSDKLEFYNDFYRFVEASPSEPPSPLSNRVRNQIIRRLSPRLAVVFFKLILIQSVTGVLIVAVCPQFGLKLWAEHGLMLLLTKLDPATCVLACGALFFGSGALVSQFLLLPEELRRVHPFRWVVYLGMGVFFVWLLLQLGAEFVIGSAILWVAGGFFSQNLFFALFRALRFSESY